MAIQDYTKIISQIPINIHLSPASLIGILVEIIISGFTLWLAVKIVGGAANFKKAIIFSLLMRFINILIIPLIPLGFIFSFIIGIFIWIILVMYFFKVGFLKAIAVAIVQTVVSIILAFLAIGTLIFSLIGLAKL